MFWNGRRGSKACQAKLASLRDVFKILVAEIDEFVFQFISHLLVSCIRKKISAGRTNGFEAQRRYASRIRSL
jgi:hypothetical protein